MPNYGYEAITPSGKEVKNSIEAENMERAKAELRGQGLTVLSIEEQGSLQQDLRLRWSKKPTARDLSVMCRQFVSMSRAGVSIIEAIKLLCEQTENRKLQRAMTSIRASVEKGEPLAEALAAQPKIFPGLMVHMIAAGEASGSLDVSMERMAIQFEKDAKTTAMVKKAMIYPSVLISVVFVVILVMLLGIIPNYMKLFSELGTELPAITKAVVSLSNVIRNYWFLVFPGLFGLVALFRFYIATPAGRYAWADVQLRIKPVRNVVVKTASARMGRTLGTLLTSGVPLVEAVDIVSGVMGNPYFRDAVQTAKEEVMAGVPLSRPLADSGLFPPMVYHMMHIGEESGTTEDMLDKLADYYEEEVEMAVQSLLALMEPAIILVLAVVVLILVGACMAPILQLYQSMSAL